MTLYMIAVQISETFIDVAILSHNKTVKKIAVFTFSNNVKVTDFSHI